MKGGPFLLGLTGSIGMGKTTTAEMFRRAGIPVWDADAVVHRLYGKNGGAVPLIKAIYPRAVVDGQVKRDVLKAWIAADPGALAQIEAAVHPLVAKDRTAYIAHHPDDGIVLFDIPLLFETSADAQLDAVVVVTAPADIQRARVLARDEMTAADFETILAKQMPDAEKRRRADYVIRSQTLADTQASVQAVIDDIRRGLTDA